MNYQTHAARIAANIVMSELQSIAADIFPTLAPCPDGTVWATSKSGAKYHLKWCVTHQTIETIEVVQPQMIIEIAA